MSMCDYITTDATNGDAKNGDELIVSQLHNRECGDNELSSSPSSSLCEFISTSMVANHNHNQLVTCDNNSNNKCRGIIVPIDVIESPTIDAVLNSVPLVYNPITKQLLLQKNSDGTVKYVYKNGFHHHNHHNGIVNLNHNNHMDDDSHREKCLNESNDVSPVNTNDEIIACRAKEHQSTEVPEVNESHDSGVSVPNSNAIHNEEYKSRDESFANESLSSLSFDDCESSCSSDVKPKRSFPLSLQNIFFRVKRKNGAVYNNSLTCSTTALILENRPPNLPAKDEDEEKKHKQEYEEMIKEAKKKETKISKLRKKLLHKQHKQEEQMIGAIKLWTNDLLPNWDRVKDTKKIRDVWWKGIPARVREHIWQLAIGNELNITSELFDICVNRSKEKVWTYVNSCDDSESVADLIKLDVSRTFPQLGLFQERGPYYEILSTILGAYFTYRPDIGYVQGMSFLAAMLLLNMESTDAFISFCNLLNNQLLLSFFRVNQSLMNAYYNTYEEFFKENLPKLYNHFNEHNLSPDLYLVDYIYTLFSRSLPLDIASRIWDLFLRDGDEFIFRASLGILSMHSDVLLNLDFIHLAQFLTKLPDDIDGDELFANIANIRMFIGNDKINFLSVLSTKILGTKS